MNDKKMKLPLGFIAALSLAGVIGTTGPWRGDVQSTDADRADLDLIVETAQAIHASWPTPLSSHSGLSLDWMTAETNRRLAEIAGLRC